MNLGGMYIFQSIPFNCSLRTEWTLWSQSLFYGQANKLNNKYLFFRMDNETEYPGRGSTSCVTHRPSALQHFDAAPLGSCPNIFEVIQVLQHNSETTQENPDLRKSTPCVVSVCNCGKDAYFPFVICPLQGA